MSERTTFAIEYIVKTPGALGGRPRLAGRRIAVDHIVHSCLRQGMPIEEFCEAYDVTPAQVHAALSYYYDHQEEIDALIEEIENWEPSEEARANREWLFQKWQDRTGHDPHEELTVTQIAEEYGIAPQTIREAAKEGWVNARKSGSTWLIKRLSAHERWKEKQNKDQRP